MKTTGFITHCLRKAAAREPGLVVCGFFRRWLFALCLVVGFGALPSLQAWAADAEIIQLRTELADDGIVLSAQTRFELPPVVQEALLKGIPLFFVMGADIYRDRWYWSDVRVASSARTVRLAFQPLTQRWRINTAPGLIISNTAGLRASLTQNFDTLSDALSAVQRTSRWKIAELSEVEAEASSGNTGYRLEYRFRLDMSQLPRPFQIGVAGQKEWVIQAQRREPLRLSPEVLSRPAEEAAPKATP